MVPKEDQKMVFWYRDRLHGFIKALLRDDVKSMNAYMNRIESRVLGKLRERFKMQAANERNRSHIYRGKKKKEAGTWPRIFQRRAIQPWQDL